MGHPLQLMSSADYAAVERSLGAQVTERNGVFWRRVRPFFYRPVLPVQEFSEAQTANAFGWPNGFQYALSGAGKTDSALNFIMLDNAPDYSVESLGRRRKQLIRAAGQMFQVKPLRDLREFQQQGFAAYRSFYERTGYTHRADRKNEAAFQQWAETVFKNPKVILLGGYGPDGLVGVSRSYWVGRTLVYATLFCETNSLKKNLGELMFHELRLLAAQEVGITEIFVRNYQGGNSLDNYYLMRGCKLVSKPAKIVMPAAVRAGIKYFLPKQHALLAGKITVAAAPSAPE